MKNKKILKEQSGREELEKFFTIPNCFTEDTASIEPIEINRIRKFAIKKLSKDKSKYNFFTADGKIYQQENDGTFVDTGIEWSCNTQGKTKLPIEGPVVTARISPAVQYFNKLNIDLNVPDQIDTLNDSIDQINRYLRNGGRGKSFRNFVYFVNAIKKDPKYDEYVGVTGDHIGSIITEIPENIIQGYSATTGDSWKWYTDPGDEEMKNFTPQNYKINNTDFPFYIWKGSARETGKVETGYDSKKCYEELNNYIQSISDPATTPSEQMLMNNKRYVEKCYGRFWYSSQLNDRDESKQIKLNLSSREKNDAQEKLRKLLKNNNIL